ncbi:MAG: U32 family peptidase [Spirochaetaceae bacterium]|jgi:collagenase-like PrtC family protease|nr:U32 family peptidase [Spirochaetaceae bacterium]
MELLAPAGSMQQAMAGIESGADALYGGLKEWNARNRAVNFSVEEYKILLSKCHKKNVLFYLTINTLLSDEEIDEIRTLFHSGTFVLPDAVIAADVGFIRVLRDDFPDLSIHASTQFGAISLSDILFLEELGVRRAVLARELTLAEIMILRRNTCMELEIFVFGSQCICFSGQCLWASTYKRGSGNRGRCTGMCRDVYRQGNISGQYFYPQDIDASALLSKIHSAGIDSIKIEGRMRPAQETAEIVSKFRTALDGKMRVSSGYGGYLNDNIPVHGMLNAVNPRTLIYLSQNDKSAIRPGVTSDTISILRGEINAGAANGLVLYQNKSGINLLNNLEEFTVETNKFSFIPFLINKGVKTIIFDFTSIDQLKKSLNYNLRNVTLFYKLPLLDFSNKTSDILFLLEGKNIMITRISQIAQIKKLKFNQTAADYSINVWNRYTSQYLKEQGIIIGTLHPELTDNPKHFFKNNQIIVYGKIPLGYTRACFKETGLCKSSDCTGCFTVENIAKGYSIKIDCNNEFGFRKIEPLDYTNLLTYNWRGFNRRIILNAGDYA